jgi:hypothetical protein
MDTVILVFVSLAVIRAIVSLILGVFRFARKLETRHSLPGQPYVLALQTILPLLIAGLLVVLYFKNVLTPLQLLLSAGFLYGCEFIASLLIGLKFSKQ